MKDSAATTNKLKSIDEAFTASLKEATEAFKCLGLSFKQLPAEIQAELESTRVLTQEELDELGESIRAVQVDPEFQAELAEALKAQLEYEEGQHETAN